VEVLSNLDEVLMWQHWQQKGACCNIDHLPTLLLLFFFYTRSSTIQRLLPPTKQPWKALIGRMHLTSVEWALTVRLAHWLGGGY